MAWVLNRLTLGLGLGLLVVACGDDGSSMQGTESTSSNSADGSATVADDTMGAAEVGECVQGQLGCTCLNGGCAGSGLFCVEDMCVAGPSIDIGDDRTVLPGVIVRHEVDVTGDEYSWSQVSGPSVEIMGADTLNIAIAVPPDAAPGDAIRLRLEASRNGVTLEEFWSVGVLETLFENVLPGISDPGQIGTTEGLSFRNESMYVVSTEGFVSVFNTDGEFVESYDLGGSPAGANFMGESLLVANAGLGSIQQISNAGNVTEWLGGVGQANYPLVDGDGDGGGNVYLSTRLDQTVIFYDGELGSTSTFIEDPAIINPNALTFGPTGNNLFVGAVGHVWRVPILDGGGAGEPEDYLDIGDDGCEVDGLVFDEALNLWVGCPGTGTLYVAHYSGDGPTELANTFTGAGASLSGFVNLRFGGGDFDRESLYYTNLDSGTVGRLRVGLGRQDN